MSRPVVWMNLFAALGKGKSVPALPTVMVAGPLELMAPTLMTLGVPRPSPSARMDRLPPLKLIGPLMAGITRVPRPVLVSPPAPPADRGPSREAVMAGLTTLMLKGEEGRVMAPLKV